MTSNSWGTILCIHYMYIMIQPPLHTCIITNNIKTIRIIHINTKCQPEERPRMFFIVTNMSLWHIIPNNVLCSGIFFAFLGRGPRAFQIGKISAVNHYFGKFSKQTRTAFLVSLKTKLAITHTIAIKLKENRMHF